MALAVGRLDLEGAGPGNRGDLAEADLHARHGGVVGKARGHRRAVEHFLEIVKGAEVDDFATGGELVEAERLQARAGDFGGGGQSSRTGADDDHVVGGGNHGCI